MVSEFLIDIVFSIVSSFFMIMPDISWNVDMSNFSVFFQIIGVGAYLLPMGTVAVICGITFSLMLFRILISFVKTVWDVLPFV